MVLITVHRKVMWAQLIEKFIEYTIYFKLYLVFKFTECMYSFIKNNVINLCGYIMTNLTYLEQWLYIITYYI